MQARRAGAAGYKIGLTSKRMQEMCGIDSPIAGVVLSDRVHASGAMLNAPVLRPDGRRIRDRRAAQARFGAEERVPSLAEVAAAVDAVCPAVEIIDDRRADYRALDALSLIADNSWNAGIVLGEFVHAWPDLATVEGVVSVDGNAARSRFGWRRARPSLSAGRVARRSSCRAGRRLARRRHCDDRQHRHHQISRSARCPIALTCKDLARSF